MKLAAAVAAVVAAGHHSDRRSHGPGRSMSPSGFVAGDKVSTTPSFCANFLGIFSFPPITHSDSPEPNSWPDACS